MSRVKIISLYRKKFVYFCSSLRNTMAAETKPKPDDEFFLNLLKRVADAEGFPDDAVFDVKAETQAGNGFIGVNSSIEIQGKNKVLKLFAKAAIKNEKVRRQMQTDLLFNREIYFYETVYPIILKFQLDRNVKHPFDSVCRCYLTSAEILHETLIFEDLEEQGYVQYNKKIEMNHQTIGFVFKLYAQFHAVSYAMKDQEPEAYAKLTENLGDIFWTFVKSIGVDSVLSHYCEEVKEFIDPIKDAYVWRRTRNLAESLINFCSSLADRVDYSVIAHGDCWFNNFLFKYRDSSDQNTLEGIKILDWQALRLSSPVLDLAYFFYGIATKTTLAQLDVLLKTYHDALSEGIREMGSDPERLYPYSVFKEQWKEFSRFGLFMSFGIQRLLLTEKYEVPDPTEIVDAGGNFGDAFKYSLDKSELYIERMREIIGHFIQNDYI